MVQRGLMLLALMVVVVLGGYFLLVRRPGQPAPPPLIEPEPLVSMLVTMQAGFPGAVSFGVLPALAEALPSSPGWQIRYTTASTFARRGEPDVPWDIFCEWLDEARQFRNFRVRLKDGRTVPDEAAARHIMLSGLQAVAQWHQKQEGKKIDVTPDLARVHAAVDKLAASPIVEMRKQAEATQAVIAKVFPKES